MRLFAWLVGVIAAALALSNAWGQRPSVAAYFPPPITPLRLDQWMAGLDFDPAQREVVADDYRQYQSAYDSLRDGRMTGLVNRLTPGFIAPSLDAERTAILAALQELDDRFLKQLEARCTCGEQRTMLASLGQQRQRERLVNDLYLRTEGVPLVDLEILLADIRSKMDAGASQAARSLLADYGRDLLAELERLAASSARQRLETYELIQLSGIEEAEFAERANWDRIRAIAQPVADRFAPRYAQIHLKIADLNRSTLRRLDQVIPAPLSARLRTAYTRRVYPDLHFMLFEPEHMSDLLARAAKAGVDQDVINRELGRFAAEMASLFDEASTAIDQARHGVPSDDADERSKQADAFHKQMIDVGERYQLHRQSVRRALEDAIQAHPSAATQPAAARPQSPPPRH